MRIAVLSDIHSNLPALEAVLAHARAHGGFDALWVTGDLVGYGAHPNEVLAKLRAHEVAAVAGNHDLAACGKMGVEEFNGSAATAALWTRERLTAEHRAWLEALPQVRIEGACTLAHGSIRDSVWEYLLSAEQALTQFDLQTTPYSVVGHSHLPFAFQERPDDVPSLHRTPDGACVDAGPTRMILNAGSVGQPRDGDPRASYVLYDQTQKTFTWHRVEYDIPAAQAAITEAGLPSWLAARLAEGR